MVWENHFPNLAEGDVSLKRKRESQTACGPLILNINILNSYESRCNILCTDLYIFGVLALWNSVNLREDIEPSKFAIKKENILLIIIIIIIIIIYYYYS